MNGQRRDKGRKAFPAEVLDRFIEKAAAGKTVREIVADTRMPSVGTWYAYVDADPVLAERWNAALKAGKAARTQGA